MYRILECGSGVRISQWPGLGSQVLGYHMQAIFGAVLGARSANNTSEPVDMPGPVRFTDDDGIGRAV